MGTEKRARQKANRLQRQIEEAQAARRDQVRRTTLRWGLIAIAAVVAVVGIAWVGGAFSGDDVEETVVTLPPDVASTITDDTVTDDTVTDDTVPDDAAADDAAAEAPAKPEVAVPETAPTELVTSVLVEGDGPAAEVGDTVEVYYVGVLSSDGTEFDSNYGSGTPFPVTIGETAVIEGWTEGLVGVQAGERRQLDIPSELAYGDQARSDVIGPNSDLTFVVDVVSVAPGSES